MRRIQILLDPAVAGAAGGGNANGNPAPPAGGTPPLNDFVKGLPADLQAEKSLHTMTDVATLAKGYVHAQKLIGTKRLSVPDATWGESQWNEFYEAAGRPKTADAYVIPKIEGMPEVKPDHPQWKKTSASLFAAGLTQRQVDAVLGIYGSDVIKAQKMSKAARDTAKLTAESALKDEWRENFDVKRDAARAVALKFGDEGFQQYITEGGGNDPRLIKFLSTVADAMMEDKSRGGNAADGLHVTDQTRAKSEIDRLKRDKDFMAVFLNKSHAGHKAAVQQMLNLQTVIYGSEKVKPS